MILIGTGMWIHISPVLFCEIWFVNVFYALALYNWCDFDNNGDVDEYVIESNKILFDYLYSMDKIIETIDYEDYLYSDLSKMIKPIYDKKRVLKRWKRII